jgi:23S rRNA (pseudouridine1915-N3)-methyltransferase
MSFLIAAIGRMRAGPEAELFARYAGRIRPKLEVCELAEGKGAAAEVKRREGEALLAALPPSGAVMALHPAGKILSSEAFAETLQTALEQSGRVSFLIGGAEGLAEPVLARADRAVSFGAMIWPHMLARVMLAEQIFRARAITAGHPYHRG